MKLYAPPTQNTQIDMLRDSSTTYLIVNGQVKLFPLESVTLIRSNYEPCIMNKAG